MFPPPPSLAKAAGHDAEQDQYSSLVASVILSAGGWTRFPVKLWLLFKNGNQISPTELGRELALFLVTPKLSGFLKIGTKDLFFVVHRYFGTGGHT
jgi:hypothetical protein